MCVLRVSGEQFDVDEFMRDSNLSPYQIFHKGERRFPESSRNKTCWDDLPGQSDDALSFLRRFPDELERLVGFPNVEDVRLDFPYELRIGRLGIVGQCDYLPSTLLREAGNLGIGIELSLYPAGDETDESDETRIDG